MFHAFTYNSIIMCSLRSTFNHLFYRKAWDLPHSGNTHNGASSLGKKHTVCFLGSFLHASSQGTEFCGPRRGRSFGTAEFSFLGSCFWLQVFVSLAGCFVSTPATSFRPILVVGFPARSAAQKADPGTFRAHHAEAHSATGIRLANLAPEIVLLSNLNQLKR